MSWLESVLFFIGESQKKALPREALLSRALPPPELNISFKAKSDFVKEPIAESGWKEIWKFLMEAVVEERLVLRWYHCLPLVRQWYHLSTSQLQNLEGK
ncbi:hypothetical protein KSP39_PZI009506 [Platanthera zijinensis]|uniref:Uncharacterized protein n=1 Tax=Platanthera zijinensis TaxID=2320716 RepID=A0AAP0G7U4_9ASPA